MTKRSNLFQLAPDHIEQEAGRPIMVDVQDVSMIFNIANQRLNNLKEYFIAVARRELMFKEFCALDDISLTIQKGDVFGILGTNGSGKSTLLKIIAGILEPTTGSVTVNGNIAPLIELGAGFDHELTARENIYLNGALLGYPKEFIEEKFDEIVEFAEIGGFLDMPLKNFSSGMVSRTAFAIATVIIPDILIVDEALSVGDFMFRKKCEDRIQSLINDHQTTVLLVSHSDTQIERLCNKAIWIEKGHKRIMGSAKEVCRAYRLLGGRTGSADAERFIYDVLVDGEKAPSSFSNEIILQNKKQTPLKLTKECNHNLETGIAVIAPVSQFYTRLFATSLAKRLDDSPLILVEPDAISDSMLTLLKTMHLENVIVVNQTAAHGLTDEVLASIEEATGLEPTVLSEQTLHELSLRALDIGKSLKGWEDDPILFSPDDLVSLSVAYPLLVSGKRAPIIYASHIDYRSTLRERGFSEDAISRMILNADTPHLQLSDGFKGTSESISRLGRQALASHQSDLGTRLIVTIPKEDFAIAAIHVASPGDKIIFVDTNDLDELREILEFIASLRPISHVTFIGSDTSFSETDKEIICKAALKQT